MTGGVEESNLLTAQLDIVSTDMLGDSAGLPFGDVSGADGIKQAGFAMVNVPHDGDDRRPGQQTLERFRFSGTAAGVLKDGLLVKGDVLHLVVEFISEQRGGFKIKRVVDGHHGPLAHKFLDQIVGLDPHAFGKFAHGNHVADTNDTLDRLGNGDFGLLDGLSPLATTTESITPFRLEDFAFLPTLRTVAPNTAFAVVRPLTLFILFAATGFFGGKNFRGRRRDRRASSTAWCTAGRTAERTSGTGVTGAAWRTTSWAWRTTSWAWRTTSRTGGTTSRTGGTGTGSFLSGCRRTASRSRAPRTFGATGIAAAIILHRRSRQLDTAEYFGARSCCFLRFPFLGLRHRTRRRRRLNLWGLDCGLGRNDHFGFNRFFFTRYRRNGFFHNLRLRLRHNRRFSDNLFRLILGHGSARRGRKGLGLFFGRDDGRFGHRRFLCRDRGSGNT